MVSLFIDDIHVVVKQHSTILQACFKVGIEVPRFCFHKKFLVAGNCRICLVEVSKVPKPVAACAYPVMSGMKVYTKSPFVRKAREALLEFLLLNHPLDCPVCDQGGECDLQNYSFVFSSDSSRFFFNKRSVENKKLGFLVKTVITRCIHCTRCVRFVSGVLGYTSFGVVGRGKRIEISTFLPSHGYYYLAGNLVDICPVGFFKKEKF